MRFSEVCRSQESATALVKLSDPNRIPGTGDPNRIPETGENLTTGAYEVYTDRAHVHRNCLEPLSENVRLR
jgi:hypothetical protein